MNIKEFLLDNYIWILVVILLTIITIVGFLADKKKEPKKTKNKGVPTPQSAAGAMPISYQTVPEQPINYQNQPQINNTNQPLNNIQPLPNQNNIQNANMNNINNMNNLNGQPMMGQEINNINPINNSQPMGTINPVNNNQPMDASNMNNGFVNPTINVTNPTSVESANSTIVPIQGQPVPPLSEQVPNLAPKPVEPIVNQPMMGQEINNVNPINQVNNPQNSPINVIPNTNQEPFNNPMNFNQMPVNQNNQNNINNQISNVGPISNQFNGNSQLINNQQINQGMNTTPNVIPSTSESTIPNSIPTPQAANPLPINFVYGPQSNNNNQNV